MDTHRPRKDAPVEPYDFPHTFFASPADNPDPRMHYQRKGGQTPQDSGQWEYWSCHADIRLIQQAGTEGWELVTVNDGWAYFKRRKHV